MSRPKRLTVRFSNAEYAALEKQARDNRTTVAEVIRTPIGKQAQMTELGDTGLKQYSGVVREEFLRQLTGDLGKRAFREMRENDATVGAIFHSMLTRLQSVEWFIEPAEEVKGAEKHVEFLESVKDDMSHTWQNFVAEAGDSALTFGHAPFEIIWKRRSGTNRTAGQASRFTDGRIGVRKFVIRPPESIVRWYFDDDGGVQGLQQQFVVGGLADIPIEKMLLFRIDPRKGNPEGRSILRSMYRTWFFKKKIEEIEAIGVERDLAGVPKAFAPADWFLDGSPHTSRLDSLKRQVRNLRNDEQAGLVLPSVFDDKGNRLVDITLMTTAGTRIFDTNKVIERLKRDIAMAVLADFILLGHEKVGSFALASSKTHAFAVSLGAVLDMIESVLNRHFVPRLFALNGIEAEELPRFRHGDVESVDLKELAEFFSGLAAAGAPFFPSVDGELERWLLEQVGAPIPPPEEDFVVVREPPKRETDEETPPDEEGPPDEDEEGETE